ncbi:cell wall structural complex MreBCD, actin-like component MreB [Hyella patelloides LEGE 07179]|uniref:Cell shape-determining protein MreB n=1 Tax=Hyella patelloides LEGE 07179 TaxID=945734 RepID=A0A563VY77_9CYAN|nr:rod shape-determining protein [Hyella patelloides]VEP16233.1 cell wall structural complex MreBCD, actin-like component MreB [Hyella patelloides LEGE 07179]
MRFFRRFNLSRDIGIDLGTANTLIYVSGKGIVLEEPSVVAIEKKTEEPRAVGKEAKLMLGRAPETVDAVRPLKDGVIADLDATEIMLKEFIRRVCDGVPLVRPRMVIGVPSGVTKLERRAVMEAASEAGAKEVDLIEEPVAAAIGAGLPVAEPTGNMIVDIGGGTTEVAVISSQGKVISESIKIAGDELTESIMHYVRREHKLSVGENTAESIKLNLGSAYPVVEEEEVMEVSGLHLLSGLPRTISITAGEIRESISEPVSAIIDAIKRTLEQTPPDLAADIIDRGIMLAGGGGLLTGLDVLVGRETGIVTHIAADPLKCVVLGTGRVLEDPSLDRVFSDRSVLV